MVQGTASSVGKSLLVTALCRIYRQRGLRVAPFKAQNMSLNSAVTPDGLEIGRAQAVQAEAAGVLPRVEMNPILLKPEGDQRSQLVLMGKAVGHVTAASYFRDDRSAFKDAIERSLHTLRSEHDLVVIEGAGSPAEINLMQRDLVNMHVARLADAPVLLVGDIDRGGVFASLIGTLDLLDADDRDRVAALVVNKFRGDLSLFASGVEWLVQRSGKPVLGVIPHIRNLQIADEDSQSLEQLHRRDRSVGPDEIDIVVLRLPRISNHDDVLSLEHEPGVVLRFVDRVDAIRGADLVIIPGSKCTVQDLAWLRESGIDRALIERAQGGAPVLGICGGCQMLGELIEDPDCVESSSPRVEGLGLLGLRTRFAAEKVTSQVVAHVRSQVPKTFLTALVPVDQALTGYEIHHGDVTVSGSSLFVVVRGGAAHAVADGRANHQGNVVGTMLHGLLENPSIRASLLHHLRLRRGLPTPEVPVPARAGEIDRLAQHVRDALDMRVLDRIVGI